MKQKNPSPRILFVGGAGSGNVGDEALLRAAVVSAREAMPNAILNVTTPNEELTRKTLQGLRANYFPALRECFFRTDLDRHYWAADQVFRHRWVAVRDFLVNAPIGEPPVTQKGAPDFIDLPKSLTLLKALAETDIIVLYGGGILSSATRSRLWEMGLVALFARRHRKKMLVRSQQIGPLDNSIDERVMSHILNAATRLTIRDNELGRSELERISGKNNLNYKLLPDDAIAVKLPANRFNIKNYGLKKRRYIAVCYRNNKSVGIKESHLEQYIKICNFIYSLYKIPLLLVPMGEFDVDSLRKIKEKTTEHSDVFYSNNQWEIVRVLEKSYITVSLPHHGLIFSLRGAAPVFSPTSGSYYEHKNKGSLSYFDLQEFVFRINDEDEFLHDLKEKMIFVKNNYSAIKNTIRKNVKKQKIALKRSEHWFWGVH